MFIFSRVHIYTHVYTYVYMHIYANYWITGNTGTKIAKLLFVLVLSMYISSAIHENFPFFIPSPTLDLVTHLNYLLV